MQKIKIILVDDHQIIRDGIRALFNGCTDIEIIAEAADAAECLQQLRLRQADVALIDISLPGISGIKLTEQLSVLYPSLKVLILSMHLNEAYISGAIKAGAMGYLAKNTTREELISTIHLIAEGKKYLGKDVSEVITTGFVRRLQANENENTELLSKREMEILKLTADGLGNREISQKLFISIRTVESHKNHIMQKLGLKSSVELVRYAIKSVLINI
ncbi:MAG TPA: response regulator transcription factor [Bacteroidales bacterium]|nr:response regulator transcription factor [Bacteroidales bacterium]HPI84859.1 response regulator transcription factor [Bacteroidales bacterium]HPM92099.1 response regulator transcription factor [Bacteroidales bacterium]